MNRPNAHLNILVAYDGSDYSKQALEKAIYLARQDQYAILNIINVIDPNISLADSAKIYQQLSKEALKGDFVSSGLVYQQMLNAMRVQASDIMDDMKKEMEDLPNEMNTFVLEGNPREIIIDFAKQKQVNLIIMGSRGLNALEELFLGSVSNHVVQNATCPVLIEK